MCYTGICLFEYSGGASVGGCMVNRHIEFKERYGETPCMVGQCPHDPDDEKYMKDNKERLEEIYRRWNGERIA